MLLPWGREEGRMRTCSDPFSNLAAPRSEAER